MSKQNQWIVGVNAVSSAVENDAENVREILIEGGSKNARLTEIEETARRKGIEVRRVTGQALDGVGGS
ncbi:MAG TPA: RNA methyltransferase substrate-binding domain-containing protein, partial [Pseudoxanthomonas sp.]|nr:RNA methyltransferase substrate-binding domain-containing protein [Pseudoxanthomonas sp.]